jgi:hypothetical protein
MQQSGVRGPGVSSARLLGPLAAEPEGTAGSLEPAHTSRSSCSTATAKAQTTPRMREKSARVPRERPRMKKGPGKKVRNKRCRRGSEVEIGLSKEMWAGLDGQPRGKSADYFGNIWSSKTTLRFLSTTACNLDVLVSTKASARLPEGEPSGWPRTRTYLPNLPTAVTPLVNVSYCLSP